MSEPAVRSEQQVYLLCIVDGFVAYDSRDAHHIAFVAGRFSDSTDCVVLSTHNNICGVFGYEQSYNNHYSSLWTYQVLPSFGGECHAVVSSHIMGVVQVWADSRVCLRIIDRSMCVDTLRPPCMFAPLLFGVFYFRISLCLLCAGIADNDSRWSVHLLRA